jgi:BMFP domain-containing protein YqiC
MDTQILEDLSRKIRDLAASSPAADVEKNLRALLRHTKEKLSQLENRLNELESLLQKNNK